MSLALVKKEAAMLEFEFEFEFGLVLVWFEFLVWFAFGVCFWFDLVCIANGTKVGCLLVPESLDV